MELIALKLFSRQRISERKKTRLIGIVVVVVVVVDIHIARPAHYASTHSLNT